uniref:C2H2-type domain-containing protein n=1 Tax=Amazona collaria TaxID=241587 RepID=A0A8B9G9Z2_9PSIT
MSVAQGSSEPADDSESDVFEIVLPITVLVLSDDNFLPDGSEEQAASVPKSKEEDELEVNLNSSILLQSNGTPSYDSNSVSIWEENNTASNEDNSITYTEEKQVAESVCNDSKLYLTDGGAAGMDECQNCVLPCKTQLTERNEASCKEQCDSDDSSQKIPPLFSAGIEGRYDTIKTNSQVTLAAIPKHEEEPVGVANHSSQEKQQEIPKEIETSVEMKNPDSSENGDNEASNRSKFEDETLGSLLECDLKEEPKFAYNCSALFLNGCSSASEELVQEVGKPEMSASTSAESNTPGEHIFETLSPFPKKRENDCLGGGVTASAVGSAQEDNVRGNKKTHSRKKFSENSHGSSSLPTGNRSEVPLNTHHMEAIICKGEPLFNSKTSHSQVQDEDAYCKYVENLKVTWPSSLSAFKTYRCQHCSYATTLHSNFRLHLKLHTNERQFVCEECNKAFKTSDDLQKHSLIHLKNGYEFGHCLYVDSCVEDLEWRREIPVGMCPERDFGSLEGSSSVHSLLGSEVCGLQPAVQGREENDLLGQSQPQYYQCAKCEYATYILSNLKLHVRTHTGERPYSCSVCQRKFRTSSHLKRHRVMHYNSDYLKCRICDYSTNKWLSLKRHLASHSCEEMSSADCLYEQKQLPVKTYTCKECGYCTLRSGNLKLHVRIHTGEKPYKCSQCAIAFRTSSHLKRHLVTHLKLQCRRCKFSTFDKCDFHKHVKTHKRKHKCGKCNVMLPTKKLLEQHKRQHELEM